MAGLHHKGVVMIDRNEFEKRYKRGDRFEDMAQYFHRATSTLRHYRRALDIPVRSPVWRKINDRVFQEMYEGGVRIEVMCRYFRCGRTAIRDCRKRLKLVPRKRGWRPKVKSDRSVTPNDSFGYAERGC